MISNCLISDLQIKLQELSKLMEETQDKRLTLELELDNADNYLLKVSL